MKSMSATIRAGNESAVGTFSTPDDRVAVEAVFRAEYPGLVRLATLLTGNGADGQEVAQEAFVRWYVHKGSVDNSGAYLRTVVVNLVRSRQRRLRVSRRASSLLESGSERSVSDTPDVLGDAIAKLPYRQRTAVVLRYYEGRSEVEIAQILSCRPGTVKSLLSRALHELRRVVER